MKWVIGRCFNKKMIYKGVSRIREATRNRAETQVVPQQRVISTSRNPGREKAMWRGPPDRSCDFISLL